MSMHFRRQRYATECPVVVISSKGRTLSIAVDLHESGARLAGAPFIERDDRVRIMIGADHFNATVLWTDGTKAGIRFLHPLTPAQLQSARHSRPDRFRSKLLSELR